MDFTTALNTDTEDLVFRIIQQKKAANEVLTKVREVFPTVVVMGGAPRDWYMLKPCSDIDVYFKSKWKLDAGTHLKNLGFDVTQVNKSDNYTGNNYIKSVWQCGYEQEQIQFIEVTATEKVVMQLFPFGICKISYDEEHGVQPTLNFLNCLDNKLLVVGSELYADGHKYIQKIKQKFPDWNYYASTSDYAKEQL